MVAILLSLLGCDTAQTRPAVQLPPPARLVSLNEPRPARKPAPRPRPARAAPTPTDPGGYDLSQFRLLGLMWGEEPRALVADPTGSTRILEIGSSLGRSDGKVQSITEEGVEIVEAYRAASGEVAVLRHTLTLQP